MPSLCTLLFTLLLSSLVYSSAIAGVPVGATAHAGLSATGAGPVVGGQGQSPKSKAPKRQFKPQGRQHAYTKMDAADALAIAAFVFGLSGFVTLFVGLGFSIVDDGLMALVFGIFTLLAALLGIILGAVSIRNTDRRWAAVLGIVFGGFTLSLFFLWVALIFLLFSALLRNL